MTPRHANIAQALDVPAGESSGAFTAVDIASIAPAPWRLAPQEHTNERRIVDAKSIPLFDERRSESDKSAIRQYIVRCVNAQAQMENRR